MKKSFLFSFLVLSAMLTSFTAGKDNFVGRIMYKYSFSDLNGNDITERVAPILGREQRYFINERSYKAYDENNRWMQLYTSEDNLYYYFGKDNTAQKFDGATQTSQKFVVTKLDKQETIAGYPCKAIQIETDNITTIYYYTPAVKVDVAPFARHTFGEWSKYLQATDGALSLKFVMTDHKNKYVWTSTAQEVAKQALSAAEFKYPTEIKLKN
ncbi:hypothetical protein LJY25_02860 [Hymenobacter sp. BT175]|uniref:hypothetical protein n=1 Tax=Hymenobacter translucens TaxID=2886507 RepID=UPI001D0E56F1|nr:hypothetical protein [Hymenobacter translucens]MCC2545371.1 hypothetical protein [Hymenobacter translucens]